MANAENAPKYTATVVFPVVWDRNMMSKEMVTHTTTYVGPIGSHTLWARVSNPAMVIPDQTMVVGMPFTMDGPGGMYTHTAPATVATHSPTQRYLKPATLATVARTQSTQAAAAAVVSETADGFANDSADFTWTSSIVLGLIFTLVLALLYRRLKSRTGRIRLAAR